MNQLLMLLKINSLPEDQIGQPHIYPYLTLWSKTIHIDNKSYSFIYYKIYFTFDGLKIKDYLKNGYLIETSFRHNGEKISSIIYNQNFLQIQNSYFSLQNKNINTKLSKNQYLGLIQLEGIAEYPFNIVPDLGGK